MTIQVSCLWWARPSMDAVICMAGHPPVSGRWPDRGSEHIALVGWGGMHDTSGGLFYMCYWYFY